MSHPGPKEKPIDHLRAPIGRIIHLENMSGIALIAGAAVALVLANTPAAESVAHFWHTHPAISFGPIELDESLTHWNNDGLITVFFFVAGLEIKRELVTGDLRDPRTAALPGIAALDELKAIIFDTRETRSVVDRLIHNLHPFTAISIVPLFALANTGVPTPPGAVVDAVTSSLGPAIFLGLVIGKPIGIVGASWIAVKLGIASLPKGVNWNHMIGLGFLGGIGFTVSLFITDLAFESEEAVVTAKIAILLASTSAAAIGAVILEISTRNTSPDEDLGPIEYRELDPSTETALRTHGRVRTVASAAHTIEAERPHWPRRPLIA